MLEKTFGTKYVNEAKFDWTGKLQYLLLVNFGLVFPTVLYLEWRHLSLPHLMVFAMRGWFHRNTEHRIKCSMSMQKNKSLPPFRKKTVPSFCIIAKVQKMSWFCCMKIIENTEFLKLPNWFEYIFNSIVSVK